MNNKCRNKKIELLDVPFSCCDFSDIMVAMNEGIQNRSKGYISITNTESIYHALRLPSHFQYIKHAQFSCCDGVGVVMAGKLFGYCIPRLYGPDLMMECCQYGIDKGWRHFFYGGANGVPELLSEKLRNKFSGLITSGTYSPPFRTLTSEEDRKIVEVINKANPDILWVGLGLLKQEKWISEHTEKLNVPWLIGVGAAFDFHTGIIKRAPKVFQQMGLEWLYRLTFEPRMLIRNYYSFLFFFQAFKEAFAKKFR